MITTNATQSSPRDMVHFGEGEYEVARATGHQQPQHQRHTDTIKMTYVQEDY